MSMSVQLFPYVRMPPMIRCQRSTYAYSLVRRGASQGWTKRNTTGDTAYKWDTQYEVQKSCTWSQYDMYMNTRYQILTGTHSAHLSVRCNIYVDAFRHATSCDAHGFGSSTTGDRTRVSHASIIGKIGRPLEGRQRKEGSRGRTILSVLPMTWGCNLDEYIG